MTINYGIDGEVCVGTGDAETAIKYKDRFGDDRVIRKTRRGWQKKRTRRTPALAFCRAIAAPIGAEIGRRRRAAGLTLKELCETAGLAGESPKSRMWAIENATRTQGIRLGTIYAIASALGVEATDLMPTVREASEAAGVEFAEITPRLEFRGDLNE